jgi:hypothetical protein
VAIPNYSVAQEVDGHLQGVAILEEERYLKALLLIYSDINFADRWSLVLGRLKLSRDKMSANMFQVFFQSGFSSLYRDRGAVADFSR